ncbi:MAG: FeoA family protein [Bdellovibrionia bacterium]
MSLAEKSVGFVGVIRELVGDDAFTSRLRELGFVRGETISVRGIAPFGGPLMIEVRGAVVALRRKEAECIQV